MSNLESAAARAWMRDADRVSVEDFFYHPNDWGKNDRRCCPWAVSLWSEIFDETIFARDTDVFPDSIPFGYTPAQIGVGSSDCLDRLRAMDDLPRMLPHANVGKIVLGCAASSPAIADYIRGSVRRQLWLYMSLMVARRDHIDISLVTMFNKDADRVSRVWNEASSHSVYQWGRCWRVLRALSWSFEAGVCDIADMLLMRDQWRGRASPPAPVGLLQTSLIRMIALGSTVGHLWHAHTTDGLLEIDLDQVPGPVGQGFTVYSKESDDERVRGEMFDAFIDDTYRPGALDIPLDSGGPPDRELWMRVQSSALLARFFDETDGSLRACLVQAALNQLTTACHRCAISDPEDEGETHPRRYLAAPGYAL